MTAARTADGAHHAVQFVRPRPQRQADKARVPRDAEDGERRRDACNSRSQRSRPSGRHPGACGQERRRGAPRRACSRAVLLPGREQSIAGRKAVGVNSTIDDDDVLVSLRASQFISADEIEASGLGWCHPPPPCARAHTRARRRAWQSAALRAPAARGRVSRQPRGARCCFRPVCF